MINLKKLLMETDDYRGQNQAPGKEYGTSLDNLVNIFPPDIYTSDKAPLYYGTRNINMDTFSIYVIRSAKDRPNAPIKIYRAVPSVITSQDKIKDYLKQLKYILKHGKVPPSIQTNLSRSDYYGKIKNELEKLKSSSGSPDEKVQINPGDWVTINRDYAKEHGESTLLGKYRILSKIVPAKTLFTTGDSIHEWGYDP